MNKKWLLKLGVPILALALVSACGTANDNDNAPGDDNAPENQEPNNQAPDNEAPGNEGPDNTNPGNEAPDNNTPEEEPPEDDNLNRNNGEPTAPEEGQNDQNQGQNLE